MSDAVKVEQAGAITKLVLNRPAAFNALDAATQQALLKAAADAEQRGWALSQEKNDWYKKALTEKGMKIVPPSAKLAGDMKQVGGIMLADWEKKAGADGAALLGAYRKP